MYVTKKGGIVYNNVARVWAQRFNNRFNVYLITICMLLYLKQELFCPQVAQPN